MPLPTADPTDRTLIEAVRQGDDSALETIYDRYAKVVYGLCLRILRDEQQAQEEVINVFQEIWENAANEQYDDDDLLTVILHRARTRAVERRRPLNNGSARPRSDAARYRTTDRTPSDRRPSQAQTSEPPFAHSDWLAAQYEDSHRAMCLLTPAQREAIELSYFDDFMIRQIARAHNTTPKTIRQRLSAGMRRLRSVSVPAGWAP